MAEHRHSAIGSKCVEVGEHVCLTPTVHGDDQHRAGFFFCHDVEGEDERCVGGVNVDPHFGGERAVWGMTGSLEAGDLTLTPSIRCVEHDPGPNAHGFVRAGKWVSA